MKRKNIFGICAFAAFILILQDWSLSGISVRTWLVYLVTAVGGLLWIEKRKKTKAGSRKKRTWEKLDYLLGICLIWNILQIVTDCIKMASCKESNILNIILVILFFLASMEKFSPIYLDTILICAFAVFTGLLWHFMIDASYTFGIQLLIKDEQALASFLLLINMIATGEYCRTDDKVKQRFYFIMSLTGYFLLFINRNVIGIVLMGVCFIIFLLAYEPHREFVKRVMQMAFVYFFLLSNMSLLVNYTTLIKVKCPYSVENGVYLDLIIALAGVFFFTYWDKLPEDEDRPLYELQNVMKWVLAGVCIILFLLMAMGKRLDGMEGLKGISVLQQFSTELRKYITKHNGTFYDVIGKHGIVGGIWLICTALVAIRKIQRQMLRKMVHPQLTTIFIMYLIQSAFFSQQLVTAPIYTVLMAAALYGSSRELVDDINIEKRLNKSSVKKKFLERDNATKSNIKKDSTKRDNTKKDNIKRLHEGKHHGKKKYK